ncbi:MAG TPA: FAD-dependent monooxygenase [Pseudonocardiaceae bacterium]|jgi:2-polyprenyl-6-methoxyphenol hydroxylase-like FAD-dependent oxidoreductase|nr:FAD-dependent monooxygenase [Pseudonocardiaceae bacterium]
MNDTRTALVIGGGIAGPVAAMALRKAGIKATVYEAYAGSADGVGGGLSIAPNGQNALAVLGAADVVTRIGLPVTSMVLQNSSGRQLAQFPTSPPDLPVMQFVWRPELYRALADEAAGRGIHTEHGKRLVGLDNDRDGVTAHFADGTHAHADVLVGADGIRSTTRSLIDANAPQPRYTKLISFGGSTDDMGLPSTNGAMYFMFGRRAFFGYQVDDDASGGWFVNLPSDEALTRAQCLEIPPREWLARLRDVFAKDAGPALRIVERTKPEDLIVVGAMEDVPTVPTWHKGRVVLVGDAAHATSPSSGQGASLAMESAVQLARCLRDLPHDKAFTAFEDLRRTRVEKIIALAARTNNDKAAGPVARVFRDVAMLAMMKLVNPEKMAQKFDWQFNYRIDWDAPVTGALVAA